jgi:hypothetical protein
MVQNRLVIGFHASITGCKFVDNHNPCLWCRAKTCAASEISDHVPMIVAIVAAEEATKFIFVCRPDSLEPIFFNLHIISWRSVFMGSNGEQSHRIGVRRTSCPSVLIDIVKDCGFCNPFCRFTYVGLLE